MTDTGLIAVACGLIIGLGAIGACLGIGTMGMTVARRLRAAGVAVAAWNRTRSKADPLTPMGVRVVSQPAEAVAQADIVFMLMTDVSGHGVPAALVTAMAKMAFDPVRDPGLRLIDASRKSKGPRPRTRPYRLGDRTDQSDGSATTPLADGRYITPLTTMGVAWELGPAGLISGSGVLCHLPHAPVA